MRLKMFWLSVALIGSMATTRAEEKPACPCPIATGKGIVATLNCTMCHSLDGKGGKSAKSLNGIAEGKTDEQLMAAMMDPKKAFGEKTMMPCYKSKITAEQAPAVMAYLKSLKKKECK